MAVEFIKFLDKYVGKAVCGFLSIFSSKKSLNLKAKKILVIQLWGIGETILMLPSLKALRSGFKKSEIDVLATKRNSSVFYGNKNADKIIELKLNPLSILSFILKNYKKYDLVMDMEEYLNISSIISFFTGKSRLGYSHGIRAGLYDGKVIYNDRQHTSETFLDLVRKLNINYKLKKLEKLSYSKKDKEKVDKFFKAKKLSKKDFIIGIAPGVAESSKCRMWPLKNYSLLSENLLKNKKNKIISIGNEKENEITEKIKDNVKDVKGINNRIINTAGLFNLNELFYLIEKCNLFVGNDSGPMHIAAAQKIKTVGLFGPNLPERFWPYGKGNIAVYKGDNCDFSPCINVHKGQVPDCLFSKNSTDYQKCMKNIKVEDVLGKIRFLSKG
ncbi:MAG: glycosyltransferase family 9 protein [Candidatus Woesearchaeota archaeon]|jgi:heptosyltransferase-2|nr:glycosyltransferase family 9 protein [Candidatus Woesearchaeota archaeon]MDP7622854.1 glycosyltransferase family 9 protein [Candidatus Woesearchaeota archaeon]HJN56886.1 glycosyltransferase family 9 protein [Candidatus Woesearchaeota archaeon]|tara:strand:- start:31762 stop:32919 length:1158 start_codon:yes stop_codon:yes gene_type:complete